MSEFTQSFRTRLINELDEGKEWESRGMGAPGLVRDYAELEHAYSSIKLETDEIYDEIVRMSDDELDSAEAVVEWLHDRELHELVYTADIEEAVTTAGIDNCFDYLAGQGIDEVKSVSELYTALYFDLSSAIETAYEEIAQVVEENMSEEEE